MKAIKTYQYPRVVNKGVIKDGDISATISTSSFENNYLIIEIIRCEEGNLRNRKVKRQER